MHKPLLQSNKLHFWVSWHFMMVWLVMVRKVSKNQLQSEKWESTESKLSCRNVPIWTSLPAKLTSSLPLLCSCSQLLRCSLKDLSQLRSPGLLNFWDTCLWELLHTCHGQEICCHQQWEEFIGQGYQSHCHSVQSPGDGLLVTLQATTQNEVQGTLCFHSLSWLLANYSEGTVIIYSCKFMAEHHEIGQK